MVLFLKEIFKVLEKYFIRMVYLFMMDSSKMEDNMDRVSGMAQTDNLMKVRIFYIKVNFSKEENKDSASIVLNLENNMKEISRMTSLMEKDN